MSCCKQVLSWCLSFYWSLHSVFSSDYLSQLHHNVLHCGFLIGHIVPRNLHNVSPTWVVGHDFLQSSCDTLTNCCPKLLAELHQPLICVINDFLQSITKFRTTLAQGLLNKKHFKKHLFQELQWEKLTFHLSVPTCTVLSGWNSFVRKVESHSLDTFAKCVCQPSLLFLNFFWKGPAHASTRSSPALLIETFFTLSSAVYFFKSWQKTTSNSHHQIWI